MESPLKMSSLESPTTSSTEPTSWPCASTTFQPGSITNQETGSPLLILRTSYRAPAQQPDRALRGDRMRIGKHVDDLRFAGDPFLVAAPEASRCHLGRDSVAEVMRAAEAQGRGAAEAHRVDGGEQQRATLEVIRRVQSHLGVDVAPVGRDGGEVPLPLRAQRLLAAQLLARGLHDAPQLERPTDALVVEPLEETAERLRPDARPAAVALEVHDPAAPAGVGRREQRRGTFGARLVVHRELESELGPFVHQTAFELAVLFD